MVTTVLVILGLCFGSFANALVWRLHEQTKGRGAKSGGKERKLSPRDLSIVHGRSMCVHCGHELAPGDLLPIISWLSLRGKCRYCKKPISWQYPLVELLTAALFVLSFIYWPLSFNGQGITLFIFWLVFLVGFMSLVVYDLRWLLLPDKIVFPLMGLAVVQVALLTTVFHGGMDSILGAVWGILIGGGIFYALFQLSGGKWIGGGDVKLGALLGLIVGGPTASLLLLFTASVLGTIVAIPLMVTGKANRSSRLPFGPFLIAAGIIVYLFGASMITWYKHRLLLY